MKTKSIASIATTLLVYSAVCLFSGCSSVKERRVTARTDADRDSMTQASENYDTFGRRWGTVETTQQVTPAPQARPAPSPSPSPSPARPPNVGTLKTALADLVKSAPASVALGETFEYELRYTANESLDSLVITDKPGDGLTFVRSEPAATRDGRNLAWTLTDVDKGRSGTIRVWVKAEREGTLLNCATLVAIPKVCVATFVGKAQISITKTGPAQALINSDVAYTIVVKNTGSLPAKDVVVTDTVPEGMSHSSGQRTLTFNVGELGPDQSKQIPVTLKATAKGRHCNVARVATSNAGTAESEACTVVLVPGLAIEKTTTDRQLLINRTASYDIVVSNTGDVPLSGVVVTDTAASQTSVASAEGASVSGNTATWNVGSLAPGQKRTLNVKIMSKVPGSFCNTAKVTSTEGLTGSSEACTEWLGVTGVAVEVVDNPDPIQVGETTTFTIRVQNQGTTSPILDLSVKAFFPAETSPTTASNGGTVADKNVTWPVVPSLAAGQTITYTIQARGVSAGDSRMRVEVTTRLRQAPITELESTTVY